MSPAHFPPPPPASVGALGTASDHQGQQTCLLSWGAVEVPRKYTMSRKQVLRQMETPRTFGGLPAPHWQHNPWQRAAQSGRLLLSSRLGLLGGASVECDVFCLAPGAQDSLATPPHPPADATHVPPMSSRTQPCYKKPQARSSRPQAASLWGSLHLPFLCLSQRKGVKNLRLPFCLEWEPSAPLRYVLRCLTITLPPPWSVLPLWL